MGKHERPKRARPNHSCGSKLKGQDAAVSEEEEKQPLLCVHKSWEWKPASRSLISFAKADSNLRFIQPTKLMQVHTECWALGLPKEKELCAWPAGSPAKRGDSGDHGSLCWAGGRCGETGTFQVTKRRLPWARLSCPEPSHSAPASALIFLSSVTPLSYEGPFLLLHASCFTDEETEAQKGKMTSLR